jgi:hypothetical protein
MSAQEQLWQALLEGLHVIDAEAVPLDSGYPTGLWWYARHLSRGGPIPKSCRNEESWSRRLARYLKESRGVDGSLECRYPTPPRRRCDLVIQWPALGRVWLEVKGAWRHNDEKGLARNKSYVKHLHSAAKDLSKLMTLGARDADWVMFLLVAFDHPRDAVLAEHIAIVREGGGAATWEERAAIWSDLHRPNGEIKCWSWIRRANPARVAAQNT